MVSELVWGHAVKSGINFSAESRVLVQIPECSTGRQDTARLLSRTVLKISFPVNIRCMIALTPVTSSPRMKSSILPGKTNHHSRESVSPIKGPPHPFALTSEQVSGYTPDRPCIALAFHLLLNQNRSQKTQGCTSCYRPSTP